MTRLSVNINKIATIRNARGGQQPRPDAGRSGRRRCLWQDEVCESGVHRVQRVPATETQGRIHTSAASVAVLPDYEKVDVEININDIRKDMFCSSEAGGQSVNTTYSAVRLTHIPTGLVVQCQGFVAVQKLRQGPDGVALKAV